MASGIPSNKGTFDELYIGPTCFVQTAENRFGAHVAEDIKAWINEGPNGPGDVDWEDDEDEDDEDADSSGEEELSWDILATLNVQVGPTLQSEPASEAAKHGFPKIAAARNNLTALSQRYNLYFAAYQDSIYVYQPQRTGPQILPPPSLVLRPPQSSQASHVVGNIDHRFPHQMNHIIVGNLGNLEIVLFAYDDGDVAAYYTHSLARWIKTNGDHARTASGSHARSAAHPKLFFHENVGSSAWGLAIHEQSRLIAVSSNYHEVTVFAFALTRHNTPFRFPAPESPPRPSAGLRAQEVQRHFQSRTRTWRIILSLTTGANNIPNISFIDDDAGEAEKVAAIDIYGTLWVADIWKFGAPVIRWPDSDSQAHSHHFHQGEVRGWGVLALPDSSFRRTDTIRECLGVPGGEVIAPVWPSPNKGRPWLDTTCGLYYVKELSPRPDTIFEQHQGRIVRDLCDYKKTHETRRLCSEEDLSDGWETNSESSDDEAVGESPVPRTKEWTAVTPYSPQPNFAFRDINDDIQFGQWVIPCFGETLEPSGVLPNHQARLLRMRMSSGRERGNKPAEYYNINLAAQLPKGLCILRGFRSSVRLEPIDSSATGIICNWLLSTHNHTAEVPPWDLHPIYAERVSMLHHVPELNLVVAGSPTGRVALLTLTKTAKRLDGTPVRHGFRIERILPRKEEDDNRIRPSCTLSGVAISPAPCGPPGQGLELKNPERKQSNGGRTNMWRLILHYKDHTILMYDIARRTPGVGDGTEDDGELVVL
ncbi:hypothetical protein VTI74DRAFT_11612 [Chaetomium olivicolor]